MSRGPESDSPAAEAFAWVGRIGAVIVLMVSPGIAGGWLDDRFGTKFLSLAGYGVGLVLGLIALIAITSATTRQ
ncbi:MAG: hypothetical protein KDA38_14155, partial [Planctomycetales bacterium]|nr:hypothetical protein [Planctomycetales bacterium]